MDLTQVEVAERLGVTRTPVQSIERGDTRKKITGTMRSYARLVGWTDDSVDSVLAGGEPRPVPVEEPQSEAKPSGGVVRDLPLRITQALGEGPLIDATVLDLGPNQLGGRMIVVVRGEPDASEDVIAEDMEAWARTLPELRRLLEQEGGNPGPRPPLGGDSNAAAG